MRFDVRYKRTHSRAGEHARNSARVPACSSCYGRSRLATPRSAPPTMRPRSTELKPISRISVAAIFCLLVASPQSTRSGGVSSKTGNSTSFGAVLMADTRCAPGALPTSAHSMSFRLQFLGLTDSLAIPARSLARRRGKRTSNVVPSADVEVAAIRPPWASTIRSTI